MRLWPWLLGAAAAAGAMALGSRASPTIPGRWVIEGLLRPRTPVGESLALLFVQEVLAEQFDEVTFVQTVSRSDGTIKFRADIAQEERPKTGEFSTSSATFRIDDARPMRLSEDAN